MWKIEGIRWLDVAGKPLQRCKNANWGVGTVGSAVRDWGQLWTICKVVWGPGDRGRCLQKEWGGLDWWLLLWSAIKIAKMRF